MKQLHIHNEYFLTLRLTADYSVPPSSSQEDGFQTVRPIRSRNGDSIRQLLTEKIDNTHTSTLRSPLASKLSTAMARISGTVEYMFVRYVSIKLDEIEMTRCSLYNLSTCPIFNSWKNKYPVLSAKTAKWIIRDHFSTPSVAVWLPEDQAGQIDEWVIELGARAKLSATVRTPTGQQPLRPMTVKIVAPAVELNNNNNNHNTPNTTRSWSSLVKSSCLNKIEHQRAHAVNHPSPSSTAALDHRPKKKQTTDENQQSNSAPAKNNADFEQRSAAIDAKHDSMSEILRELRVLREEIRQLKEENAKLKEKQKKKKKSSTLQLTSEQNQNQNQNQSQTAAATSTTAQRSQQQLSPERPTAQPMLSALAELNPIAIQQMIIALTTIAHQMVTANGHNNQTPNNASAGQAPMAAAVR